MRSFIIVLSFLLPACAGADYARSAESSYAQFDFDDEELEGEFAGDDGTAVRSMGGAVPRDEPVYAKRTTLSASPDERGRGAPGAPSPAAPPSEQKPVETAKPAPTAGDNSPDPPKARLKIYTGSLNLQVPNVRAAEAQVIEATEKFGGYVSVKSTNQVTVRVPAPKFFQLVELVKKMGELIDENIEARDVTAQAYELQLRLDTARKSHARLTALLEKATKVEDVLKIETELRRLTAEIEVMQGQLRLLMDQVSFSTLTVMLYRSGPPPQKARVQSPFDWVNAVGPTRVWRMPTYNVPPGLFTKPPLQAPEQFLPVGVEDHQLRALSSEESRLWLRTFEVTGGDLDFWEKALRKDFEEGRGLKLGDAQAFRLGGEAGRGFEVATQLGTTDVKYFVAVFRRTTFWGEEVIVVELASKLEHYDADVAALKAALQ